MASFTFGCIALACFAPLFVQSVSHTSATLTDEAGKNVLAVPHKEWNSSLNFWAHLGDHEIIKRLHRTAGTFAPDSHVTLVSDGFSKSTPIANSLLLTYADDDGSIVISILQGGAAVEGLLVENGVAWHMHTVDGAPLEIVEEGSAASWCGSDNHVEVSTGSGSETRRLRGSGDSEQAAGSAPGRGLAVQRWTNCWDGENVAHTVSFGAVITSKLFASRFGSDTTQATQWLNSVVAEANLIYSQQLNIVLNIGQLIIQETAVGAPSWNSASCSLTLSQQLDNFRVWEQPSKQGFWHLFDDCYGVSGNSIGLATTLVDQPGTLCVMDKVNLRSGQEYVNTAISWYDTNTWKTFAHEVGHTFGADHSFEDGVGETGGIMDYGDGKLNGEYQFNTYRKDEICGTLQARLPTCTAVSTGEDSPSGSTPSTTAGSTTGSGDTTMETTVTTTASTGCDDQSCIDALVPGSGLTIRLNDVPYTDCASLIAGASSFGWCSFFEDQAQVCQKSCGKCSSDCTTTSVDPTTPAITTTPATTTLPATTTPIATTTPAASTTPVVTTTVLPTTTPAPTSTTVATTTSASSQGIQSGDTIFLKTRSGWSAHVDVQGTAVQARWPDQGWWQSFKIEKAGGGSLNSGDIVYLTSHTGALLGVENGVVAAQYAEKGAIQSFRVQKVDSGDIIFPDDIVCLQSHTGEHLDAEDTTVRARWNDCGDWQKMRIERENPDAIRSGNSIYLQAHTGKRIEVNGTAVGARWPERGLWQRLLIQSLGGRAIKSGTKVFLKAHTGNLIDAQAPSEIVKARWPDRGYWQTFTIEKKGGGYIMPGDTIFLRTHLGQHVDVQGDAVQARWSDQGLWQGLVIEKAF